MRVERGKAVWSRAAVALAMTGTALAPAAQADPPGSPTSPLAQLGRQGRVVPPVLDDVEQVCALLTSCPRLPIPPSMIPSDFATCVRSLESDLASPKAISYSLLVRECGLGANSCAQLRTCALRGANPASCAGRGRDAVAGYCDLDGRALSCWHEKVAAVRDCPRGGEQCAVREGEAACSLGPCPKDIAEGAAPVCSASGTRIVRCEHGVLASLDCAAFGLICAPGSPASCAPPTPACSGGASRCEGDVSVSCLSGHEVRVDCGAAGLKCAGAGSQVGSCVAPAPSGDACDSHAPARCDGASLRYCKDGKPRSYLCRSLGFSRCASDANGARCQ